jgi:CDP-6-deoxy-D-xylo-4-hexulose-3-dehydrase
MFENINEQQAKASILSMVKEYYEVFYNTPKEFHEGDRIPYAGRIFDGAEMTNLVDAALEFWLTSGRFTEQFESEFAQYLGVKHCILVNSGSSANLLAFMSLTSPLLKERMIQPGDEIITVAAGFPTTVAPIIQYGAVPVFVDITIPQYNIDCSMLDAALSPKTKAVMLAHTLGNPFNMGEVRAFCDAHQLWLIEDNCDSLGSVYTVNGEKHLTGTIGDIATSSFYPPHHITMGEGGAVYTNNPLLSKIIRSMRDWGRDCECAPGQDNLCRHRFDGSHGLLPCGYDHKYVYSHFGYNLKATDLQAAIGVEQLKKLPRFIKERRNNFALLQSILLSEEEKLILPEACQGSIPSWFGFLITCKPGTERLRVVRHLENKGIQTRMLFAGNLIMHPCFDSIRNNNNVYRQVGDLKNTCRIMNDTFWVGVYPGMTEEMMKYIGKTILEEI